MSKRRKTHCIQCGAAIAGGGCHFRYRKVNVHTCSVKCRGIFYSRNKMFAIKRGGLYFDTFTKQWVAVLEDHAIFCELDEANDANRLLGYPGSVINVGYKKEQI